ncbi:MAG: hypothetical protein WBO43_11870 [Gemmatimonadota bacterium]
MIGFARSRRSATTIGGLVIALVTIACGGDESPAAPDPGSASMVGEYSGIFDYEVSRNALPDLVSSVHCNVMLDITYAAAETIAGSMGAMEPPGGCGEPGATFAFFNGTIERRSSGSRITLTMSPNLGVRVGCVAFQVNPLPGEYHGPSSSAEIELARDFVCADASGDWLTVRVRYAGSRRG